MVYGNTLDLVTFFNQPYYGFSSQPIIPSMVEKQNQYHPVLSAT
jgi:hypothetical protein